MVILFGRGGGKSGYLNEDSKGMRDNRRGYSMDRNRGGKGITEGEEVQEGEKYQGRTDDRFNTYCAMKDGKGGDKRQRSGMK